MDAAIAFILGLLCGGSFGVFAMALLTAAKWQDEQFTGTTLPVMMMEAE